MSLSVRAFGPWPPVAAALLVVACGGQSTRPPSVASAWGQSLLGAPPSFVAVQRRHPAWKERPDANGRSDAGTNLTPGCTMTLPVLKDARFALARREAKSVEELVWKRGNDLDLVAVMHRIPQALDPRQPGSPTAFRLLGVAPSGVAAFQVDGRPGDGRLFVLPSGAWVLAVGPNAERVGNEIAKAPPPVENPRFPSAVSFAEAEGALFRACGAKEAALSDPSLSSVRLVLEAEPEVAHKLSTLTFTYATTSAAESTARELEKQTAGAGLLGFVMPMRVVREGTSVSLEVGFAPIR